jgi:hypothetical protein
MRPDNYAKRTKSWPEETQTGSRPHLLVMSSMDLHLEEREGRLENSATVETLPTRARALQRNHV